MTRSLTLLTILLTACNTAAADWPQWRGAGRDNVWNETGLPEKFPAEIKPRWKQPIGGGYSGIAVAGGKIYTMDRQKEPKEIERILCLDAADGKTLWTHEYPVAYGKMEYGNGPRSTPTVHKGRVFTFGAMGHLYCFDANNGKVIWSHDTVKAFKGRVPSWGHACSPLIDGERLIVQVGGADGACLMALEAATGKEVWRSIDDPPGYASPVLIETKEWRQFFYWTPKHIIGVDAATGKERWKIPFEITYGVSISDIVYHEGVLLASNYWSGSKAFRLDAKGEKPEIVWEGKALSLLMCTPLVRGGHVYALDRHRGVKCIEMKTGKINWEQDDLTPRGRNPHAAMAWLGDRVLLFNSEGELVLAKMTPEKCETLSKTPIIGPTWATPAFADRCIFARTDKEIVCVPLGMK